MEIQTKHLHYQFKYYKLKCVVIGQPVVLFFSSRGKDASFGSGCCFRRKVFAEWLLPDSLLS